MNTASTLSGPFGSWRPQMKDGPERMDRIAERAWLGMALLAIAVPSACLARSVGGLDAGVFYSSLAVMIMIAAPLCAAVGIAILRKSRASASGLMLSTRDLDAVVDYAHRLGISREARARVAADGERDLRYPSIESFLDWMEQRALIKRV